MSFDSELQKLSPSAVISLFELDMTAIGGDIYRFVPGTNALRNSVTWQGNIYAPWPIQADGIEWTGQGSLPRPTITVANVGGLIARANLDYDDLIGAMLIRRKTFVRFLDAVNFADGNPEADPTQHWPDEIWYVDRKAKEDKEAVQYELAAAWDISGIKLPRRQILTRCMWRYRGDGCLYAGGPIADARDIPTNDPERDDCGHRLSSCKLRFSGVLPFGGFPGAGRYQ